MLRRVFLLGVALFVVIAVAAPATSVPVTTLVRTIQDVNGDNILDFAPGEDYFVIGAPEDFRPPKNRSIINFLQMTDFQMVDEESPARVEFLDTTQRGPFDPFSAAYRPQESLTTHVTEAMVRAVRNTVSPITSEPLDLTILTGDNADSQQFNETRWFIDILDGTVGPRDPDLETFTITDPDNETHDVTLNVGPPDRIDPNSGIEGICDPDPDSLYEGVQNDGDLGYYDPDASLPDANQTSGPPFTTAGDGHGYSPNRAENFGEVQHDVTVRDFPFLFEAANHPFEAVGLGMPWYSAFGNHDALVQGNSHEAYTGPFGTESEKWVPLTFNQILHEIATGCTKPSNLISQLFPPQTGDPQAPSVTEQVVPPDPRRCFLTKDKPPTIVPPVPVSPCNTTSYIDEHFNTTGTPPGHGFADRPTQAEANHDGYYSFHPVPGLRFIVLDTVTDECGPPFAGLCSEGSVDDTQFEWLKAEISDAAVDDEYVMVFSHHTLATTRWPTADGTEALPGGIHYGQRIDRHDPDNPQNPIGGESLEELYCKNRNVLGHIAGHEHENYVRHHDCTVVLPGIPTPVDLGSGDFWHISTAAHIDWPQQSRMIELIDNRNGTMSLVLTMLDHAGPPNPGNAPPEKLGQGHSGEQVLKLASIARELSYNDYQHSRAKRGDPAVTPCPPPEQGEDPEEGCPDKSPDRNVIIVINQPWLHPTEDDADGGGLLPLLP
jgi:hypothetical protein